MKFTEILAFENIRQGMIFSSKKRLFEAIAEFANEQLAQQPEDKLVSFECLFNREKLGNSGLGQGIAMAKGKLAGIESPIVCFMQLATPLEYGAADGKDVDLVFAVLVPEQNCSQYVPLLVELAEKLLDKNLIKQLRAAKSAMEIWQIFQQADYQAQAEEDAQQQAEQSTAENISTNDENGEK